MNTTHTCPRYETYSCPMPLDFVTELRSMHVRVCIYMGTSCTHIVYNNIIYLCGENGEISLRRWERIYVSVAPVAVFPPPLPHSNLVAVALVPRGGGKLQYFKRQLALHDCSAAVVILYTLSVQDSACHLGIRPQDRLNKHSLFIKYLCYLY